LKIFSHSRAIFWASTILAGAHFGGQLVAPVFGRLHAAHRGQVEPLMGHDHVHAHALAGRIGQAEIVERIGAPLLGIALILRQ